MFWFKRKPPVLTDQSSSPEKPAGEPGKQADGPESGPETAQASRSIMSVMNEHLIKQVNTPATDSTAALNQQIVQAVQFTNSQTLSYAPAQIAIAPDMMIGQGRRPGRAVGSGVLRRCQQAGAGGPSGIDQGNDQEHRPGEIHGR